MIAVVVQSRGKAFRASVSQLERLCLWAGGRQESESLLLPETHKRGGRAASGIAHQGNVSNSTSPSSPQICWISSTSLHASVSPSVNQDLVTFHSSQA